MWPLWRGQLNDWGYNYWPLPLLRDGRYEEALIQGNLWIIGWTKILAVVERWPLK